MLEGKKIEQLEQFRRSTTTKSKQKSPKPRAYPRKEVFLTDTQTSDYTKSSTEMRIHKIEQLQLTVRDLQRENEQLKQSIINMRANQFFQLNQEKLKDLIRENQRFRVENGELRRQLEQSLIERDFLKRFNKNLKNQCEVLTKKIISMRNHPTAPTGQVRKIEKSIINSSSEDIKKGYKRSVSAQVLLTKRKNKEAAMNMERKERQGSFAAEMDGRQHGRNIVEPSPNFDYFHGSFNKQKKSRHANNS